MVSDGEVTPVILAELTSHRTPNLGSCNVIPWINMGNPLL